MTVVAVSIIAGLCFKVLAPLDFPKQSNDQKGLGFRVQHSTHVSELIDMLHVPRRLAQKALHRGSFLVVILPLRQLQPDQKATPPTRIYKLPGALQGMGKLVPRTTSLTSTGYLSQQGLESQLDLVSRFIMG